MARKVRQMRGKGNHIGLVPVPSMAAPDLDTRIALIQALIPVALEKVHVELQADVERLAGERYVREGRRLGHVRWTAQRGSIYLADQKIPLAVPRVRDRLRNQEVPLPTYERLQAPRTLDAGLLHKVLGGLSTREYERCAEAVPEAFGLSASTVSRRFKRASARKLQELLERRLDRYDVVALLLDGKTFAEDEMVAAVGITITGEKVLLGFVQTATENRKVCAAFLREVFGTAARLQRCQWHKRENVLAYLPERHRPTLRRKLQAAYEQPTWAAKRALPMVRSRGHLFRKVDTMSERMAATTRRRSRRQLRVTSSSGRTKSGGAVGRHRLVLEELGRRSAPSPANVGSYRIGLAAMGRAGARRPFRGVPYRSDDRRGGRHASSRGGAGKRTSTTISVRSSPPRR